ncbi:hypothetical protein RYB01_06150 [Pseudomonas syringae]|nr:hypothetical protein [Pseudomonas syringae]
MKTAGYIKTLCGPHSARIKTIAMMTVLSALLGCQPRMTTSTVPPEEPHSASRAAALELWHRDNNVAGGWKMTCSIPWGEHVVRMGNNSFGCPNDKAGAYRLSNVYPINGRPTIIAFYDKKCDDGDLFNDDYYKYRLTGFIENFWPNTLAPDLPLGEVTEGLTYFEGYYKNGIDGYLSCVKIYL